VLIDNGDGHDLQRVSRLSTQNADFELCGLLRSVPAGILHTFIGAAHFAWARQAFHQVTGLGPSCVLNAHMVHDVRKLSAPSMDAQMILCIMSRVYSEGNLAHAALLGQSLGAWNACSAARQAELSAEGLRVVIALDIRKAVPSPLPPPMEVVNDRPRD